MATHCEPIKTDRLVLRVHRIEDFDEIYAIWSDPAVTRYIGGNAFRVSPSDLITGFQLMLERARRRAANHLRKWFCQLAYQVSGDLVILGCWRGPAAVSQAKASLRKIRRVLLAPRPDASPAGPAGSAILAAAEQLMQPPEWADFEPGALLGAGPPEEAAVRPLPESGSVEDDTIGAVDLGTPVPAGYSLSMLMLNSGTLSA
jgi:hypothetical protein